MTLTASCFMSDKSEIKSSENKDLIKKEAYINIGRVLASCLYEIGLLRNIMKKINVPPT
jgi:hypothetical protein